MLISNGHLALPSPGQLVCRKGGRKIELVGTLRPWPKRKTLRTRDDQPALRMVASLRTTLYPYHGIYRVGEKLGCIEKQPGIHRFKLHLI